MIDYGRGISVVDAEYQRPGMAGVHLIVENGRAAVVDTGVNASVPAVLRALAAQGVAPRQVDYVILTHVHLDHAGGAGRLMAECPEARLAVHPRGARHMADPSRLVAGATAVYGVEAMRALYGDILPVAPERIVETGEGAVLTVAGRELRFLDTPGHARHHVCIVDGRSGHVFTGDTFGLSYRELDRDGRPFVFPATTPVQFDPAALHDSVERLAALKPGAAYLTHFGQVRDIPRLADDLHRLIDAHVAIARASAGVADEARHAGLKRRLSELVEAEARGQGWALTGAAAREFYAADIELNAQGLGAWLDAAALPPSPRSRPARPA